MRLLERRKQTEKEWLEFAISSIRLNATTGGVTPTMVTSQHPQAGNTGTIFALPLAHQLAVTSDFKKI
jgi:hypothetical protein